MSLLLFLQVALCYGGNKYPLQLRPLSKEYTYLIQHPETIFWNLMPYYVGQEEEWSCSVASLVMVLNGARSLLNIALTSEDELFTEAGLKKCRLDLDIWKQKKGATLAELTDILRSLVTENKLPLRVGLYFSQESNINTFQKALKESEQKKQLIIVNFIQGSMTLDASTGHFAVIGAYDAPKSQVLVLDPDRRYYEPYWGPVDKLWAGMLEVDPLSKKSRGFMTLSLATS